mmetsp:Transcript_2937/g.8405  ORF Transcript_2937/g.8405 Transcript_2937/m.8405 type:complete len:144 (-) Transcript_2937:639-1070(-)
MPTSETQRRLAKRSCHVGRARQWTSRARASRGGSDRRKLVGVVANDARDGFQSSFGDGGDPDAGSSVPLELVEVVDASIPGVDRPETDDDDDDEEDGGAGSDAAGEEDDSEAKPVASLDTDAAASSSTRSPAGGAETSGGNHV